jgi:hypothetical protein
VELDELERRIRRLEELAALRAELWPDPAAYPPQVEPEGSAESWTTSGSCEPVDPGVDTSLPAGGDGLSSDPV